jgi:hypothetical protein
MSEEQIAQLTKRLDAQAEVIRKLKDEIIPALVSREVESASDKVLRSAADNIALVDRERDKNTQEIAQIKLILHGDGDRNRGTLTELSEVERHMETLLRIQEEWQGVSGNEERPGVATMVHRLWLEYRDRTTRGNFARLIWTGGGLTALGIAITLINGTVDRNIKANADRSASQDRRIGEVDTRLLDVRLKVERLDERVNNSINRSPGK